jgi:hypothetical protein
LRGAIRAIGGDPSQASQGRGAIDTAVAILPLWMLPLFLLIVSMSWFSVLLSYRALSTAKYMVIAEMENDLPIQPFMREWVHYKQLRKVEMTQLELAIPLLFYLAALAGLAVPFLAIL